MSSSTLFFHTCRRHRKDLSTLCILYSFNTPACHVHYLHQKLSGCLSNHFHIRSSNTCAFCTLVFQQNEHTTKLFIKVILSPAPTLNLKGRVTVIIHHLSDYLVSFSDCLSCNSSRHSFPPHIISTNRNFTIDFLHQRSSVTLLVEPSR